MQDEDILALYVEGYALLRLFYIQANMDKAVIPAPTAVLLRLAFLLPEWPRYAL